MSVYSELVPGTKSWLTQLQLIQIPLLLGKNREATRQANVWMDKKGNQPAGKSLLWGGGLLAVGR